MRMIINLKAYLLKLLTKKNFFLFDIKDSKSVLILKYDRIGDMIVSTPIFRELKLAYPNISISVPVSYTHLTLPTIYSV